MHTLIIVLLSVGFFVSGCASNKLEPLELDSALDAKLAKSTVSAQAPDAGPGEPQKGFSQETAQALNP